MPKKNYYYSKQTQVYAEKTRGLGIKVTQKMHEKKRNAASNLCWQPEQDPCRIRIVFEIADVHEIEVHDVRT